MNRECSDINRTDYNDYDYGPPPADRVRTFFVTQRDGTRTVIRHASALMAATRHAAEQYPDRFNVTAMRVGSERYQAYYQFEGCLHSIGDNFQVTWRDIPWQPLPARRS